MKNILVVLSLFLSASFAQAQLADLSYSPSATTVMVTLSSLCAAGQCSQKIIDAKEDAAIFVATEGELRSPQLLLAFDYLRSNSALTKSSDQELAEAIIAY